MPAPIARSIRLTPRIAVDLRDVLEQHHAQQGGHSRLQAQHLAVQHPEGGGEEHRECRSADGDRVRSGSCGNSWPRKSMPPKRSAQIVCTTSSIRTLLQRKPAISSIALPNASPTMNRPKSIPVATGRHFWSRRRSRSPARRAGESRSTSPRPGPARGANVLQPAGTGERRLQTDQEEAPDPGSPPRAAAAAPGACRRCSRRATAGAKDRAVERCAPGPARPASGR